MAALNSISENCLQLTFIAQITIICRDVRVKVKLRSITVLTYAAEVLVALGWIQVVASAIDAAVFNDDNAVHTVGNVVESVSLVFVLVFRFFYLSLSGGFRRLLATRKLEFALYTLFALHEVPFVILESQTNVSWEFAQGVCNRATILACIVANRHHKAQPRSAVGSTAKTAKYSMASVTSSRGSIVKSVGGQRNSLTALMSSRGSTLLSPTNRFSLTMTSPDVTKIAVTNTPVQASP